MSLLLQLSRASWTKTWRPLGLLLMRSLRVQSSRARLLFSRSRCVPLVGGRYARIREIGFSLVVATRFRFADRTFDRKRAWPESRTGDAEINIFSRFVFRFLHTSVIYTLAIEDSRDHCDNSLARLLSNPLAWERCREMKEPRIFFFFFFFSTKDISCFNKLASTPINSRRIFCCK